MDLKELVPPLELCKLIPEGEFRDSALYWGLLGEDLEDIMPRECGYCTTFRCGPRTEIICPAPTLQEIMYDLPQGVDLSRDSEWFCSLDMTNEYYDKTPATAALKVWLKLKGIEA